MFENSFDISHRLKKKFEEEKFLEEFWRVDMPKKSDEEWTINITYPFAGNVLSWPFYDLCIPWPPKIPGHSCKLIVVVKGSLKLAVTVLVKYLTYIWLFRWLGSYPFMMNTDIIIIHISRKTLIENWEGETFSFCQSIY